MSDESTSQSTAVVTMEVEVEPTDAAQYAFELNERIKRKVVEVSQLAFAHLELGILLKEMRDSQAFKELGFKGWEAYLKSFDLSRSYLATLLKLGQAGDLEPYVSKGIGASKLLEYAKQIDYPEKIAVAIDLTLDEISSMPVRKARKKIADFIAANQAQYKKPRKAAKARGTSKSSTLEAAPALPLKERLYQEYLSAPNKNEFVEELEAALQELTDYI